MSDENLFWQGLATNPDDEPLRMAFVRWLEERNDPRSSWIRNPEIVRAMDQPWADPTANLVKRLGEPYRREHVTAGLVLMGAGAVPMLVPALAGAIRRDDYQVREQVHQILEQIGPAALGYLSELQQQLVAEDAAERQAAVEALRFLGPGAAPVLPLLCDRLREDNWQIVHEAIRTIGAIGPAAGPAAGDLQAVYDRARDDLTWPHPEWIRHEVVKALGNLGPAALAAVPALMRSFIIDSSIAEEATDILIALGPAAAEPVLQFLDQIDSEEHGYAADVLAAVAPDELLFGALDDRKMDSYLREVVLQALGQRAMRGKHGPQGEIDVIVHRLVRVLREEDQHLQDSALHWLKEIGRAATVAIPDLREVLRGASGWLRGKLVTVLEALGESDVAVADLETRLRSADVKERVRAVGDLWKLRAPQANESRLHQAIALLVPLFQDPAAEVRQTAVKAVANMAKPDTPGALSALCAALKDSSAEVRKAAVQGLGGIQAHATWHAGLLRAEKVAASSFSVPHLIGVVQDVDPGVRALAVSALNKWPDRLDVITALRELLACREFVDRHVLDAVAERHTLPDDLLPEVMVLTRDPDPAIRSAAVRLLSRIESTTPDGAAVLCQALRDRQHTEEVVRGLKRYGPMAAEALPDLLALLEGKEVWSEPVVATLVSLGPMVVPAMRQWLRSDQPLLQHFGADVLFGLGAAGAEVKPELLGVLLNETDYFARLAAAAALCRMGPVPADALPGLVAMAQEREPQYRAAAAQVLGRMGRAARPSLPTLERLLEDGDATVRLAAMQALAHLVGEHPEAMPPLRRQFQDADPQRRQEALDSVKMLEMDILVQPHIYPLVQSMLDDPAAEVRKLAWTCVGAVARSLAVIGRKEEAGPTFEDLLTLLRRNLHHSDPEMRTTAAYQIGKLGEAAAAAVPELQELLDDPETMSNAIMALGDIGPPAKSALPILRRLAQNWQTYDGERAGTAVEKIEMRKT